MEPTRRTFPADQPPTYRIRPWRVAFAALCIELVAIAALGNQGVAGALRDTVSDPDRAHADYTRGAVDAATTFAWRFAPSSGQPTHTWAAQFAGIGTLLLLTLLVVAIVARGAGGFWRVLVAVWAVAAALTPIAVMVRNVVVVPDAPGPMQSRMGQAVYGYGAFGPVIVAGLALGLVTGLVAAIVARASRRMVEPALPVRDEEADEYLDTTFAPRYVEPAPYPRYDDHPTEQFRGYDVPSGQSGVYDQQAEQFAGHDQPTEQFGRYGQPTEQSRGYDQLTEQPRGYDQPTGQFRSALRNDEDLAEHPPSRNPYANEQSGAQPTAYLPEPQADEQVADPQATTQLPVQPGEETSEQPPQR